VPAKFLRVRQHICRCRNHQTINTEICGQLRLSQRLTGGRSTNASQHRNPAGYGVLHALDNRVTLVHIKGVALARRASCHNPGDTRCQHELDHRGHRV
jgi:hypothetical protein